ncbi:MAG: sulfatase [Gemmataceae bacterium]
MKRIGSFLFGWIAFLLLLGTVDPVHGVERPNVLFLNVDDMNWDSVGTFGCPIRDITPHIDKLASQGMRFQHGHVTIAICMPTRAVWMTGRYPHRSGALGFDRIRPDVPTLLEALHDAGYQTGILAKVPHVVPSRGQAWDVVVPAERLKNGREPKLYYQHSQAFFDQAKQAGKPFFLMANMQDPHRPFAGGPGDAKNTAGVSRTITTREAIVPSFLPDIPEVRQEIAEYFTSVHRADECVGGVLKALDEAGLAGDTLVTFMSDHGMALPFAKTNCYLNSTKTPWIVRWPGVVKAGTVDDRHFVSGIDFAPTILEAVGLPPLPGMDGRSLVPLLKGEKQANRDHVFTHINTTAAQNSYPMRAVQDAKYGYIYNAWSDGKRIFRNESQSGRSMKAMQAAAQTDPKIAARVHHFLYRTKEELYDYEKDPDALHNLANDPKYREQLLHYRRLLFQHMKETNDPQLAAFQKDVLNQ